MPKKPFTSHLEIVLTVYSPHPTFSPNSEGEGRVRGLKGVKKNMGPFIILVASENAIIANTRQ
jgi:hypothetical protein